MKQTEGIGSASNSLASTYAFLKAKREVTWREESPSLIISVVVWVVILVWIWMVQSFWNSDSTAKQYRRNAFFTVPNPFQNGQDLNSLHALDTCRFCKPFPFFPELRSAQSGLNQIADFQ